MVSIASLWLPILLSAVLVFLASFVIHMVLPFHRGDFKQLPAEDEVMAALRKFDIPPGDYMVPRPAGPEGMKSKEFADKLAAGPVMMATVMKRGPFNLGPQLAQWFLYCLVVGVFAAYVTGRALGPGTPYLQVHRFAGVTAFAGYALALWQDSIWYKRDLGSTVRHTVDGLVYALLTGGTFGWLWPR